MDNNVRFRKEVMGFNKDDVYEFIESLYQTFDVQLKQKDDEIERLSKHNASMKQQIQEMQDKFAGVEDYKSSIADVLLKAKEQGGEIIKDAIRQGEAKKREIEERVNEELHRLETFREELRLLKQGTVEILAKYQEELQRLTEVIPE